MYILKQPDAGLFLPQELVVVNLNITDFQVSRIQIVSKSQSSTNFRIDVYVNIC